MGLQDRDWYKEAQEERDAKIKKRSRPVADLLPKTKMFSSATEHIAIAAVWALIFIVLSLLFMYMRSKGH